MHFSTSQWTPHVTLPGVKTCEMLSLFVHQRSLSPPLSSEPATSPQSSLHTHVSTCRRDVAVRLRVEPPLEMAENFEAVLLKMRRQRTYWSKHPVFSVCVQYVRT